MGERTALLIVAGSCENGVMGSEEVERLHTAFALFDDGVELMRANLRRTHPQATHAEVERLLAAWLAERPGAEHGDGVGRPRRAHQ